MGNGRKIRYAALVALAIAAMLLVAGCQSGDPGALDSAGVDGVSSDQQKQDYTDGVGRALQQLGTAQGANFGKAIDTANGRALRASSLAWEQGVEQLKQVDPPKDVLAQHTALLKSVETLDTWNKRIAAAAPNKSRTRKLGQQASASPASQAFAKSVCAIVDAGYSVVDATACSSASDSVGSAPSDGSDPALGG